MKKFLDEINGLVWTWAGSAMVFITLSGPTLDSAIKITVVASVVQLVWAMLKKSDE